MILAPCLLMPLLIALQTDPQIEFRRIAQLLRIEEGSTVADIGAGSGSWTRLLLGQAGNSGTVYATEVKPELVQGLKSAFRTHPNLKALLGSQEDLALPDACCDAVLLRLVYHAFRQPDRMRQGLSRSVRPGGRILIIDFPGGARGVKPGKLTEDMAAAGFDRIDFIDPWQGQPGVYAILFQKRL